MNTLLRLFLYLIVSFLLIPGATAQCELNSAEFDTARGTVYLDANHDGAFDRGERGVEGVRVSNGCEVVRTAVDGSYQIPITANTVLFISKPAGYSLPLDDNNIPKFFYRHYPQGTPTEIAGTSVEWLFLVIEPTGALPTAINFALYLDDNASADFTAHGFADTQAMYDLGEDMLREDLVNPLIGNPYGVKFGITVGDVAFDNLAIYTRHKAMMGLMDIPQWYIPGNHDLNYQSPTTQFANETYKRHFGPTYYSFDEGRVHVVALNNVEYEGLRADSSNGDYRGFISDRQLAWLANDLQDVPADGLIVIATHIPLLAIADDGTSPPATGPGTDNFSELIEILRPFENIYGIAGHDTSNSWKVQIDHNHDWSGNPWIAHTLAEVRGNGWTTGPADLRGVRDAMMQDGNPNGFYVLKFAGVDVIPEFIPFPFGPDANQRLRITLDPLLSSPEEDTVNRGALQAGTKVVVNLFDGGVRDSVWLSLDGANMTEMTYTVRTDPHAERIFQRLSDTSDAIGRPTRSAHIWEFQLPDELSSGIHRVEVISEDEFGQIQWGTFSFEILSN
ncbi:MAG: calcineurin-like phosphoesterase C-terminal domain-containing protein [Gammaproteobacteria bacterium]|nr:calcineurin-like phosphoesterase C-terminal domain-containing protein [Gammaproteobacteria bacterium]MDP6733297.1 calcineurin-like phosphoesterase C-terminal domain-containing protein [Gammaproteobacteria bacterium]